MYIASLLVPNLSTIISIYKSKSRFIGLKNKSQIHYLNLDFCETRQRVFGTKDQDIPCHSLDLRNSLFLWDHQADLETRAARKRKLITRNGNVSPFSKKTPRLRVHYGNEDEEAKRANAADERWDRVSRVWDLAVQERNESHRVHDVWGYPLISICASWY